jgi:hypothetical protein
MAPRDRSLFLSPKIAQFAEDAEQFRRGLQKSARPAAGLEKRTAAAGRFRRIALNAEGPEKR